MNDVLIRILMVCTLINLAWVLILTTCFFEFESLFDKRMRYIEQLIGRLSHDVRRLEEK